MCHVFVLFYRVLSVFNVSKRDAVGERMFAVEFGCVILGVLVLSTRKPVINP